MLPKIKELVEALNGEGVRYCHWKSNAALAQTVAGRTDFDLLVDRRDAPRFRSLMTRLLFRPVAAPRAERFPSMEHHYALDEESGMLVHVHAYFRVITGESLVKNYHLPLEEMLLQNIRDLGSIRVPTASAELVIFTLRMMLKHTTLVELLLLVRDGRAMHDEIAWLSQTGSPQEAADLVRDWLPSLDPGLFSTCAEALRSTTPAWRRVWLGLRLRRQLAPYSRHFWLWARLQGAWKFSTLLLRRLFRVRTRMSPLSGGAVIAFVGPEATGKSTLLAEVIGWLGGDFTVERIHAGKPPATVGTAVPNIFLPALRSLLPGHRSSRVEARFAPEGHAEEPEEGFPLLFALRSVMLAYDRRALLCRAFSRAAGGAFVLCDRYPSVGKGAPDGPQMAHLALPRGPLSLRRFLARLEGRLYRQIPPPDLVLHLTVPVEIAVARNETRGKKEPEDYVRLRHAKGSNLDFGRARVHRIATDRSLEETVREVKRTIWSLV